MRIQLLSVGRRMPKWIDTGFQEYAKRLPRECTLNLVEIDPGHRRKGASVDTARRAECERMLAHLPKNALVIALALHGHEWSTEQLARQLAGWMSDGRDIALLVGGPEGLAEPCIQRAERQWSLSSLTFPHPLVRVILAEQLYRAWSILKGHPYHRE
ncbi:MAG: 23S rRNA (pseudouridine(1915)-N(3))-methyltransferase RlmH [Chromatiaceae bacterium]|nr:23S rRNA (pseudouridine(1915)-N(3))-methyltransferase RlmH [Chromatiaceae bacterium]